MDYSEEISWLLMQLPRLRKRLVSYIQCADGFTMSVQASQDHKCIPVSDKGPWTHFEVGFPSEPEVLLKTKSEDEDDDPSIFECVPANVIAEIIIKHGGVVFPS